MNAPDDTPDRWTPDSSRTPEAWPPDNRNPDLARLVRPDPGETSRPNGLGHSSFEDRWSPSSTSSSPPLSSGDGYGGSGYSYGSTSGTEYPSTSGAGYGTSYDATAARGNGYTSAYESTTPASRYDSGNGGWYEGYGSGTDPLESEEGTGPLSIRAPQTPPREDTAVFGSAYGSQASQRPQGSASPSYPAATPTPVPSSASSSATAQGPASESKIKGVRPPWLSRGATTLHVAAPVVMVLAVSAPYKGEPLWQRALAWTLMALVASVTQAAPILRGTPAKIERHLTTAKVSVAGLVAFWILVALPILRSNLGFVLTVIVVAAASALWIDTRSRARFEFARQRDLAR